MTSIIPYHSGLADQVLALWQEHHPDWEWLNDAENRAKVLEMDANTMTLVVMRDEAVIGTAFGNLTLEDKGPPNRFVMIEMNPADITAEVVDPLLAAFADADRERADIWHVMILDEKYLAVLPPLLEDRGFTLHDRSLRMEWSHEEVVVEPPPPGVEIVVYTGGNTAFDQAIVDLHNRAYRPSRLTPGADLEYVWAKWATLTEREYILGLVDGQVMGYADWMVSSGKAIMNSLAVARAYWGKSLAQAVGTKAMERMWAIGHRTFQSGVSSRNAASIKLQERFGWHIAAEESRRYVRKF